MKDFKRHNPFITPAGYFDQFAASIMQQVAQMPAAAVRPARSMVRRIQMWVSYAGIAAVVALVFIVGQGENGELTSGTSGTASVSILDNALAEATEKDLDAAYDYLTSNESTIYDYATENP